MTHFNKVANEWDTPEKVILNEEYSTRIKNLIFEKNPKKILEIGCGTGLLGSNFLNDNNTLLGIDTSEGMLEVFNQKFKDLKNVRSLSLNLEESELNETGFDLIISSMAFHHLKRPDLMLLKLKKALSENGSIVIIDLDKEDGSFHPDPSNMGVFHFGFSDELTQSWASKANLKRANREIVHTIIKNDKSYPLFLDIYTNAQHQC